jgi:hypothetical protein
VIPKRKKKQLQIEIGVWQRYKAYSNIFNSIHSNLLYDYFPNEERK